jgi:hypothetical protein
MSQIETAFSLRTGFDGFRSKIVRKSLTAKTNKIQKVFIVRGGTDNKESLSHAVK